MQQNLILVSQFCNTNHSSVEFFPTHFLVKDLTAGAPLLRGRNQNNVYEWPSYRKPTEVVKQACVGIQTSFGNWHNRLGHPSEILQFLVSKNSLLVTSRTKFFCDSCLYSKSHRLPFGMSIVES